MEVSIKDATVTGDILNEILLQIEQERITVSDLIRARVTQEVQDYNYASASHFNGLVHPATEKAPEEKIDAEKQVYVALDAFNHNGFFVLIDDRQVETLDEEVLLSPTTEVNFVKLTPLVGG